MFTKIFLGIFVFLAGIGLINKIGLGNNRSEYNYEKLKATAKREEAIKSAIIRYIVDTNSTPTIQNLIDNHYISSTANDNGFGGNFTLNIDRDKGSIDISTTFATENQSNIYNNLYSRTISGTKLDKTITTKHLIPTNLSSNVDFQDSFRTYIGNIAPNPNQYSFWIDTSGSSAIKKRYSGSSWDKYIIALPNTNPIKTGSVVTSISRLSDDGASTGDIKYVYNEATNTIDEYVYYNDYWTLKDGTNGDITITDYEGHIYGTVTIGSQTWLDRNMQTKYYPDGTLIDTYNNTFQNTYSRANDGLDAQSLENDTINNTWGYLYQWDALMNNSTQKDSRGICPYGFHIPSNYDFLLMFHYLDNSVDLNNSVAQTTGTDAGTKSKVGGSSDFEAILTGYREGSDGTFHDKNNNTYLATSSQYDTNQLWGLGLDTNPDIFHFHYNKDLAYSVRCMKDQKSLLDTNDVFGDGSIIGTWKLDGNGHELGGNYTNHEYHTSYSEANFNDGLDIDGKERFVKILGKSLFCPDTTLWESLLIKIVL